MQSFTRYPSEAQAWAAKQGVPQPPGAYSPLCPSPEGAASGPQADPVEPSQPTTEPGQALIFTSPDQGTVLRLVPDIPPDKQRIRVSVRPADGVTPGRVTLLHNGQPLAEGSETLWQMVPGEHTFEAVGVDRQGQTLSSNRVTIRVVEP